MDKQKAVEAILLIILSLLDESIDKSEMLQL